MEALYEGLSFEDRVSYLISFANTNPDSQKMDRALKVFGESLHNKTAAEKFRLLEVLSTKVASSELPLDQKFQCLRFARQEKESTGLSAFVALTS